ncbi:hypothetical protein Fmac_019218 [Flemingia macrophylla]|uniref:Uncharacterized protein n=1 Tax=Flemingia macrophylla TaxID=520843 RepID=A0ABD1M7L9_9FABA
MAMDVKGITWVGNIFQKFEDIYVEVEDAVFEETVKYIGNQMQTVGESVKKIYSEVMQDLLSPSACDVDETSASELPTDQYIDAGLSKKSFQGYKKMAVKADTNQTIEDSRTSHDVVHAEYYDSDALFMSGSCNSVKGNTFISHESRYVGSTGIKSDLGGRENQNKNMPASKTASKISSSKTDKCSTSQSCELSRVNQNHAATVSKSASAEVTRSASIADSCNEIENASTEEIPDVLALAESVEEKEMHSNSHSSTVVSGDLTGVTMVRTIQPDNYSFSYYKILASHPEISETRGFDVAKVGTWIKQGHKTMQQDDELKVEETCVMVTRDELLQSIPNAGSNLIAIKNKKRQPFSLSKKAARRKEYEELAILHGNNEKDKGDCAEHLCSTLQDDHNKLLLPDISEPEWELL